VKRVRFSGKSEIYGSFVVDDEDYERVVQHKWRYYDRYVQTTIDGKIVRIGRFIMEPEEGQIVLYRNGDRLDNRRANLRVGTRADLGKYRAKYKRTRSRYRGVSYSRRDGKWVASITKGGRSWYLGGHGTEEEAARMYDLAALTLYGSDARLNFEASRRMSPLPSMQYIGSVIAQSNTGYRGVHYQRQGRFWTAKVMVKGKRYFLGCFRSAEDAARAYNRKARELLGERARLNYVVGPDV